MSGLWGSIFETTLRHSETTHHVWVSPLIARACYNDLYIYIYIHGLTCFNTLIGCDLHNQGFQILLNMFHRVFE